MAQGTPNEISSTFYSLAQEPTHCQRDYVSSKACSVNYGIKWDCICSRWGEEADGSEESWEKDGINIHAWFVYLEVAARSCTYLSTLCSSSAPLTVLRKAAAVLNVPTYQITSAVSRNQGSSLTSIIFVKMLCSESIATQGHIQRESVFNVQHDLNTLAAFGTWFYQVYVKQLSSNHSMIVPHIHSTTEFRSSYCSTCMRYNRNSFDVVNKKLSQWTRHALYKGNPPTQ